MIVALQYWHGDEERILRLARLLTDIEKRPRRDARILFIRRYDCPISDAARVTADYVSRRFPVMVARSKVEAEGYPEGANGLMAGTMEHVAAQWRAGELGQSTVFLAEGDGCPLRRDWIDKLLAEHQAAVMEGNGVTGPYMANIPHINGTMLIQVPWWIDHPSVHVTPREQGWDIFHRETIVPVARRTKLIINLYGAPRWSHPQLKILAAESAWFSSCKNDSVISWAEKHLARRKRR